MRRFYLDGPYGQIHLRAVTRPHGRRPLVCFHLTPGSGRMYEALLAELGADRTAVAPDTPGYGASDPPPGPPAIGDYAAVMAHVVDRLGLGEVDLLGYHTGSKIAMELAIARPDLVHRLVLVSAPAYTEEEEERQRRELGTPAGPREDGGHLLDHWRGLLRWQGLGQTLPLVQREFAEQLRAGPRAHWGYLAAFAYRHADHLPRVPRPVLLLCPDDDLRVPTRRARSLLRDGEYREVPWGHGMADAHTAELAALLRDFLDRD
ncbi:alpha/beta hydrolase [Nonomuraea sp. MCN248]|uniref:Alpha/beta hydrolase n=1 Tax=Nonomuraea corallina TaxID=2989783 RepID=A0ABT4SBX7_9ACTN|nr:alpha/beta hydrolase [Nonomuraea corallina]MDA0634696.1 alpha/beta hydrolase [Nonomuraea corallina]